MTTESTPGSAERRWKPLTPNQRRVLGVMVEKAKTTPAAYPMTLNAIVTGCNQKNNRDPVTDLEDGEVERTLDELTALGAASEAPIVSRVPKYRHHAYEWLGVNRAEMAVMAELLLRGAQSLGDLRARAARMEPIADLTALKPVVDALVQRGLMIELTAPGRGQIVSHNLYREPELAALRSRAAGGGFAGAVETPNAREPFAAAASTRAEPGANTRREPDAVAALKDVIAELRGEIARLDARVTALESRAGTDDG